MALIFPKLDETLFTLVKIKPYAKMGEDGASVVSSEKTFSCYFEENINTIRDNNGENIKVQSLIIIYNDYPELKEEEKGEVEINNKVYKIENVARFYNFTNTVHHIELTVI